MTQDQVEMARFRKLVERARALEAENEKLRAVVQIVADADNSDHGVCYQLCELEYWGMRDGDMNLKHITPCVVEQAEALMKGQA